jgi:ELWxxDGT repeat protein
MKKLIILLLLFYAAVIYGQNPKKITSIPGTPNTASFSWPCNGLQFYQDYVAATNNTQIWRTDGTANGTFPVTNFATGAGQVLSNNKTAAVVGNTFYFSFYPTGAPGYQIWKTDGTINGTSQVNISPITVQAGYILANSTHLFLTSYPTEDLYSIDISGQITYLAKLKNPGAYNSLTEGHAAIFRDKLVVTASEFNAQGNPTGRINLFITDGTTAGSYTQQTLLNALPRNMIASGDNFLLMLLPNYPYPNNSIAQLPGITNGGIGNLNIFYTGTGASDLKEYKYHESNVYGNSNGLQTFQGNSTLGNSLLLSGRSDNHGWELWKTDGTAGGTILVKDIYPGPGSGFEPWNGFVINGKYIFDAYTNTPGRKIFYSDGTTAGTDYFSQRPVSNDPNMSLTNVCYRNNKAYFISIEGIQNNYFAALWQTDGSIENTRPVTAFDVQPDPALTPFGSVASGKIIYKSNNYITALDTDYRLWNGSANNAWTNTANWENNTVPVSTENILVPGSASNYPLLNADLTTNNLWLNAHNATITNNAVLTVNGELGVSVYNTLNGSGSVKFSGTGSHVFDGTGSTGLSLTLSGGDVTIAGGNKIIPQLNFQGAAKLFLGNYDLSLTQGAGVTGFAGDRYVVTNGNGRLILPAIGTAASSTSTVFPVGNSANSYTPATVTNNGTSQQFSVRTIEGLFNSYNTTYPESPTATAYPNSAVNKTWFINKQSNGNIANASVQLQWNSGDELPGLNRNAIQLAHYSGGGWITGPSGAASGSGPYTYTRIGLTSFSPFGIANYNLPLPIVLNNFTASYYDDKVKLQWQTSLEQNASHFIIERSLNGIDYISIGRKEATGNSSITTYYNFTDMSPFMGTGFYRLKMYDLDNNYKFSKIVSVKTGMIKSVTVFPNPAEQSLQIQILSEWKGTIILRVLDVAGRIIQTQSLQKNANSISTSLDITKLASGAYLLSVEPGDENKETIRFVKR